MNLQQSTVKKYHRSNNKRPIITKKNRFKPIKPKTITYVRAKKFKLHKFQKQVLREMNRVLPRKKPYKVGITKDIFEALKEQFPEQKTRLRKTIKFHMRHKTVGRHYLEALKTGAYRYDLNGKRQSIMRKHRAAAKMKLRELKKDGKRTFLESGTKNNKRA